MGQSRRHCIAFYKGATMVFIVLLSFFSCKEDDYQYPPVKTDFVSVTTNGEGRVDSLFDDNGERFAISLSGNNLTKDSLYRCVATYSADENGIRLYALQNIVSPDPVKFEHLKTDPVSTVRVWLGGGYVNMVVKTLGQTKAHRWGLNEDSFTSSDSGRKRLSFTLYHDINSDYPAFSRETYLSFPLRKYTSRLTQGDSLFINIHQTIKNKDSLIVYSLSY